jgi:glycosyltransferase involved in cell wall biosynthesis
MPKMKIALVVVKSISGEEGGAEKFFRGLHRAFQSFGHTAEMIELVSDESSLEAIEQSYEDFRKLDLMEFDMVVSTKAPSYAICHPNHIVYLVHTMRVFYDMFENEFKKANPELKTFRKKLIQMDNDEFTKFGVKKIFTIGKEVTNRLEQYNHLKSDVLYPPLEKDNFYCAKQQDYIFIPSRLHRWKRIDLIIQAMQYVTSDIELRIAGAGEDEDAFKQMANSKVRFLGRISDDEIIEQYANCLAVPFVPQNEDYGYVTIEAFKSKKPVITCIDSGEPKNFVQDGINGFVCTPDPKDIAKKIDFLSQNRVQAQKMGEEGFKTIEGISWENVVSTLVNSADNYENDIVVVDMQPIDPPVGGGRLRLLGLYHGLGDDMKALYIGSYDWRDEKYRDHYLTSTLREIDIPLSLEHFLESEKLSDTIGFNVIDLMFHRMAHLSQDYIMSVIYHIKRNKTVIFSHPWVYPLVKQHLTKEHLVIYDSQNVESYLRYVLHHDNAKSQDIIKEVISIEYELCCDADLILCCSNEDRELFNRLYNIEFEKMELVPNGVFTSQIIPVSLAQKQSLKKQFFKNEYKTAIFIGSGYGPNIDAAKYIYTHLASALPDVNFIIAGSVGNVLGKSKKKNVLITGFIDDEEKLEILQASDFAINPVMSGSGTNIKMFDFMSAGLPVVTTDVGARGIKSFGKKAFWISELQDFEVAIRNLIEDSKLLDKMSKDARSLAEEQFSFENISYKLGYLIESCQKTFHQDIKVSIVIPSYERKELLLNLLQKLNEQSFKDFEVIVIDQSAKSLENELNEYSYTLKYINSRIKGAVKARNFGGMLARGTFIGFIDDDCYPINENWIENAYSLFMSNQNIVGIEGKISSDHLDDPNYRSVSNIGCEGLGFMTANLFISKKVFNKLNGFDESFENPHFREDTDFGWRALDEGLIPYAEDVEVFHPAHKKEIERESDEERDKFFIKDPLLMAKHPSRYKELFLFEGHYKNRSSFWNHFLKGLKMYDIDITKYDIYEYMPKQFKKQL